MDYSTPDSPSFTRSQGLLKSMSTESGEGKGQKREDWQSGHPVCTERVRVGTDVSATSHKA